MEPNVDEPDRQRCEAGVLAPEESLCCTVGSGPRYREGIQRETIKCD